MGIIVNNIKPIRIMFNGVEATLYHNGIKIWPEDTDPYNPPSSHTEAFKNSGSDTTTGAAELAQIPEDWK